MPALTQTQKKKLLMHSFTLIILLSNLAVFLALYHRMHRIPSPNPEYQKNLKQFLSQYQKQQKMFQNFTLFVNYDKYVYTDAVTIRPQFQQNINWFSNITQEEFYKLFDVVRNIANEKKFGEVTKFGYNHSDWSRKDAVIRDQRGFNTSFIFASLTAIQYQINKPNQTQTWVTLSAQQIIDCCQQCMKTRKPQTVFDYIQKYGVMQQKQYPYQNSRFDTSPKKCRKSQKSPSIPKYFISHYQSVKNCPALEKRLAKGPLVVGIDGLFNIQFMPKENYTLCDYCRYQCRLLEIAEFLGAEVGRTGLYSDWAWGYLWGLFEGQCPVLEDLVRENTEKQIEK